MSERSEKPSIRTHRLNWGGREVSSTLGVISSRTYHGSETLPVQRDGHSAAKLGGMCSPSLGSPVRVVHSGRYLTAWGAHTLSQAGYICKHGMLTVLSSMAPGR